MRTDQELSGVSLLGNTGVKYPTQYSPSILETFPNKHPENEYLVTFDCPEFTSLCPKTGQPDFARILIRYIPRVRMVESKSLKLYLFSFRNHGDFHEDCINIILNGNRDAVLYGQFHPRQKRQSGCFKSGRDSDVAIRRRYRAVCY